MAHSVIMTAPTTDSSLKTEYLLQFNRKSTKNNLMVWMIFLRKVKDLIREENVVVI